MSKYFPEQKYSEWRVKFELSWSNYATKADLKNETGIDTWKIAEKADLANLKPHVDKLDIEKLKNIPTNLSNLKSEVNKLDVGKLAPVRGDLGKLSDVVKKFVAKKDVYNAKIKNIEDKTPDITNLATNTTLYSKINEVKKEIPSVTNIVVTTALNAKINEIKNNLFPT